jgi:hypothetical protein
MQRQNFFRRVVLPISFVLAVMVVSINIYNFSRRVANPTLHLWLANGSAVFMFLSIWLGSFFSNTLAFFRGATFAERIIVSLTPPVIWCLKILSDFIGIYSTGEFFFLLLHHFILGCPLVALLCMGVSEIWCRVIARRKTADGSIKVLAFSNMTLLIASFTAVFLMLWNGGHSYYYLYMNVYAKLFL